MIIRLQTIIKCLQKQTKNVEKHHEKTGAMKTQ